MSYTIVDINIPDFKQHAFQNIWIAIIVKKAYRIGRYSSSGCLKTSIVHELEFSPYNPLSLKVEVKSHSVGVGSLQYKVVIVILNNSLICQQ